MKPRFRALALVLSGIVACSSASIRAEVALEEVEGSARVVLMMSITDGADPVGMRWTPVRDRAGLSFLNARGDSRIDGYPQLDWGPWGGPAVVWAYTSGAQHDIAFSEGSSGTWTPVEFLTAAPEDEVDPRIFIAQDGVVHVVWWVDGIDPRVVLLRSLPLADDTATPAWLAPVRVDPAGEAARRPSVAVFGGSVHVAYQRDVAGQPGRVEVVVRREEPGGGFVVEQVFPTQTTGAIDPVLHADGGRVWLDWKYSATQYASSHLQGGSWGPTYLYTCTDPSWVGIEGLRKSIGSRIVSGVQAAAPVGGGP